MNSIEVPVQSLDGEVQVRIASVNVADDVVGGHGLRCLIMVEKIAVFGLHCNDGYSVISYIIWAISYISMEFITLHSNLVATFASSC